jgi:DNA-binding NtrC family response regulator
MSPPAPQTITTILVVESEAIVRMELARRISEMGLSVFEASDADSATAMLDAHPQIGILLTNIKTAGSIDGIRLAHQVRERWPPVKIIITSGMIGTQQADLPPGTIFLSKPYRFEAIKTAVFYLMGRRPLVIGQPSTA